MIFIRLKVRMIILAHASVNADRLAVILVNWCGLILCVQ